MTITNRRHVVRALALACARRTAATANRRRARLGARVALGLVLLLAAAIARPARARAGEPSIADCLAASDDAIKLDNDHKLRAERTSLLACAAATCPVDVRRECIRRVDEISTAIPTIIFEAKDGAGNDLSAVKVTMDDEPIVDRLDGIAVAIDPGAHVFRFEATGQRPVNRRFVVRQGQKNRSELVLFDAPTADARAKTLSETTPAPSVATAQPAGSTAASATTPAGLRLAPARPPDSHTHDKLAITAAAVGVLGAGVGAIFGLRAISERDSAQKICSSACTDQSGVTMWHDARTAGDVATGAFIVGGVALASAAVLWLTDKPETPSERSAKRSTDRSTTSETKSAAMTANGAAMIPTIGARAAIGSDGFAVGLAGAW